MFDYSTLPASSADAAMGSLLMDGMMTYTFMESVDEGLLYKDLNKRLMALETSLTIDKDALQVIMDDAKGFRLLFGEKDEVMMRIGWLERLDKVQQEMGSLQTREEAQQLSRLIASCQTSPLKNHLITKLDSLVETLPSEQVEDVQMTAAEVLMEKAVEEAGDTFINLGKAGRDSVIADILEQFGKNAAIEAVREHTIALEQRVEALTATTDGDEFIKQLGSLPLPSFHALPADRKGRIAENLLEKGKWNGVASLDRMIVHLDKAITNEEQRLEEAENTLLTSDGKAALTLDIKSVVDGKVQLG